MDSSRMTMLVAAMLLVGAPAVALELPSPFSATYVGRPYGFGKLETVITLERSGSYLKYTMRSSASAPFYRNAFYECSLMQLRGERIYPLEYKHTDSNNPDKNLSGRFDWDTGTATIKRAEDDAARVTGLAWPVWDPLSLQIGIMTDLINGKFGTEKVYRLLDRRGITERTFRNDGEERVATNTASLRAVRIVRVDRAGERLWLASDYRYVPAMIEIKRMEVELVSPPTDVIRSPSRDAPRPAC